MKHLAVYQKASNHLEIQTNKGIYLISYDNVIAFKPIKGKFQLDIKYWDYSKATGKHRNDFLRETKRETQQKIDSKEYLLTDLNC